MKYFNEINFFYLTIYQIHIIEIISFLKCIRKYYKKHRYIGTFEVTRPTLMILEPNLAKDVLTKYFEHFENNSFSYTVRIENTNISLPIKLKYF